VDDPSDFVFPQPWRDLRGHEVRDSEVASGLSDRLGVETAEGHPLFGMTVRTVAKCTACDHVLYDLGDSRYALVHLTWTRTPPDRPPWPMSTVHGSWGDAVEAVLAHEPYWE
jgi:hypothetical protein